MLLYLAFFFFLFGMVFALPGLLEGARDLGPGPEELTPEELARARDTAREALQGGRLLVALALRGSLRLLGRVEVAEIASVAATTRSGTCHLSLFDLFLGELLLFFRQFRVESRQGLVELAVETLLTLPGGARAGWGLLARSG